MSRNNMFGRLPNHPSTHPFVTSGQLALWAEYQTRIRFERDQGRIIENLDTDPDLNFTFNELCLEVYKKILGTRNFYDQMPEVYSDEILPLVKTSLCAAERKNFFKKIPFKGQEAPDHHGNFQLNCEIKDIEFPPDFLDKLRQGFLRHALCILRSPNQYKARQVLAYVVKNRDSDLCREEHTLRIKMKVTSRLHKILNGLLPFVYNERGKRHNARFQVNELGIKLCELLQREFIWRPGVLEELNSATLSPKQMLVLLSLYRLSKPDPTDSDIYNSALSLITRAAIPNDSYRSLWFIFYKFIENDLSEDFDELIEGGYVDVLNRKNGEKDFQSTAYWLVLSEKGMQEIKNCFLQKSLVNKYLDRLIDIAHTQMRSFQGTDRMKIMEFAGLKSIWTEEELRVGLSTTKSLSHLIRWMYPFIVLDESHFGRGNRYKLGNSQFTYKFFELL